MWNNEPVSMLNSHHAGCIVETEGLATGFQMTESAEVVIMVSLCYTSAVYKDGLFFLDPFVLVEIVIIDLKGQSNVPVSSQLSSQATQKIEKG